jgi:hypothetical protein
VAIGAIVGGHVASIWLAHRVALREFGTPRKAVIGTIPLTALMLAYTAISLSVIAEPIVKFGEPSQDGRMLSPAWTAERSDGRVSRGGTGAPTRVVALRW